MDYRESWYKSILRWDLWFRVLVSIFDLVGLEKEWWNILVKYNNHARDIINRMKPKKILLFLYRAHDTGRITTLLLSMWQYSRASRYLLYVIRHRNIGTSRNSRNKFQGNKSQPVVELDVKSGLTLRIRFFFLFFITLLCDKFYFEISSMMNFRLKN